MQSHQFESSFSPTDGFVITPKEITDGGSYTCHFVSDPNGEFDLHFNVIVTCELNKCHGCASILNKGLTTASVAPNTLNQITTISTSHLTTIATASKSMIKPNRLGVGRASLTKRHISSNSSNASIQSPSFGLPSNQQLLSFDDVDVITTTESITTVNSHADNIAIRRYSNRRQMPTQPYRLDKRRGKS